MVGFWPLDQAQDWTPPPALRDFLSTGRPPIYVGFGSMLAGSGERLTELVLEAIRRSGRRAIVATGWGALQNTGAAVQDDVLFVDNVPHDWLFPRVSIAVHHGGAGTTAAAARAGLPQVVVPFVADQFFWAWAAEQPGTEPDPSRPQDHDRRGSGPGDRAGRPRDARHTALRLGGLLRAEDGAANAIRALERWGILPGETEPSRSPQGASTPILSLVGNWLGPSSHRV